jgi:hypothetical protein
MNIFKSDKPPSLPPIEPTTFLIKPGDDETGIWLMNASISSIEKIISSVEKIILDEIEKEEKIKMIIDNLKKI